MLLGFFHCAERAQVFALSGLGIFFARIEPVLAGLEFANHVSLAQFEMYPLSREDAFART